MISLLSALSNRDSKAAFWNCCGGWISVEEVLKKVSNLSYLIPQDNIALAFTSDELLAIGILASEGRCRSVLLVPASCDQLLLNKYLTQAGISCLITNRSDLSANKVIRVANLDTPNNFAQGHVVYDTSWIIPTSGTTGNPKLVNHKLATLTRTVRKNLDKGRCLNWGLIYELARFAGLQVFFQALLGGSKLIFLDRSDGLRGVCKSLIAAGCNAISATPTWWRRLMMLPEARALSLKRITLGGEIADEKLLKQLTAIFQSARITHVYASTEAGVGFSVTDGRAGFPADWLLNPPADVELKVNDEKILLLRPKVGGQQFLDNNSPIADSNGWIDSGDLVRYGENRFYFLGRANGAINVGGNKVYPEEVEECIRRIAGVNQVSVRARPNPIVGSLVEALVLPEPETNLDYLKKSILQTCRSTLAPYKVPAIINWVDVLEYTSTGKLLRL